ncbi:unnamed protein product [Litomosoides sigmodontis]|uniref:Uncharacterized protein n=1 Tax=Litomosoides sigmodontis TaxID=42156 RepID=A0A3P6SR77_LITSI|nr:unnamed protein product [Litomosoides sigmodontis]
MKKIKPIHKPVLGARVILLKAQKVCEINISVIIAINCDAIIVGVVSSINRPEMRFTQILPLCFMLSHTCTASDFALNWTDEKIARMNQQTVLEMRKLRELQMESMVRSERGHLLAFAVAALAAKVVIAVGIVFALQACWIQYDDYDIENSKQMFHKHWISETTRKEEMSGIPTVDFTYREENSNKLAAEAETEAGGKEEILRSNFIKIPIWFGCVHLFLSLLVIAGTLFATIWWRFTLQPLPSVLLDFCAYDLELCQRQCDTSPNEVAEQSKSHFDVIILQKYPPIVSNDLKMVAEEVQESFNSYLSILDDKPEKLKWTLLSVSICYILSLTVTFISSLNSFFQRVIWTKICEWKCSKLQRRAYLFLDVISVTIIVILYLGISMEQAFTSKFNLKLKECRRQLDFCFC